MDRRRFEAAHLKYACLQMAAQYPDAISLSSVRVEGDVTNTLSELTPSLFCCFEARYAGLAEQVISLVTLTVHSACLHWTSLLHAEEIGQS